MEDLKPHKDWENLSRNILVPALEANLMYYHGAHDFMKKAIEDLQKHYEKVDIHDEFESDGTKAYLKALTNAIEIIKKVKP